MHFARHTQGKRESSKKILEQNNETEMECVLITPFVNINFNEAEDIIQKKPWQDIQEEDFCAVQSNED
ncbi:unnamed protein product [Rhizophagus irregularis]|nr:unnamed protein product [Rhizophagus irregularis]